MENYRKILDNEEIVYYQVLFELYLVFGSFLIYVSNICKNSCINIVKSSEVIFL